MDIITRLLKLFLSHRYEMTDHALEAMDDHRLLLRDLVACFKSGRLYRSWPRISKYEIEGAAVDGRVLRLVSRLTDDGSLRIITVYEVH
jgi:hypothetical protein